MGKTRRIIACVGLLGLLTWPVFGQELPIVFAPADPDYRVELAAIKQQIAAVHQMLSQENTLRQAGSVSVEEHILKVEKRLFKLEQRIIPQTCKVTMPLFGFRFHCKLDIAPVGPTSVE